MKRFIPGRDAMDKGRFEAFTDGVFAIAITLLVLEIHVPDLKVADDAHMRAWIGSLGEPLVTYALSFATVGIIWLNHHAAFARITDVDRTTNLLNLLLLAVVCLLPYPTALVARYGPLPSSTAFYGATFTAMGLTYGAVWIYARLRQSRIDPGAPRLTLATAFAGSAGTLIYGAGTLIALVAPRLALALFVCVTLYYLIPGLFNPWRELALRGEAE